MTEYVQLASIAFAQLCNLGPKKASILALSNWAPTKVGTIPLYRATMPSVLIMVENASMAPVHTVKKEAIKKCSM